MNQRLTNLLTSERHIIITGLSRSGKSTLLTSLMAQLNEHANQAGEINRLPFLTRIPANRLVSARLVESDEAANFDFAANLAQLQQRKWPQATTRISQFTLELTLKRQHAWQQRLLGNEIHRFIIYDYPGEWLMDLSLADLSYSDWSAHVLAQQTSEPQLSHAQSWLAMLNGFDFDLPVSSLYSDHLVHSYQQYLQQAKADGISRLQPGALLLTPPDPAHLLGRFCPLPAKVLVQPNHPWLLHFQQRYQDYLEAWVKPLRDTYFRRAQQQIVLLDLFEGLAFGRAYLAEMQESLNQLMSGFIYGKRRWYERLHKPISIERVTFVASKCDLVPLSEQPRLLSLLKHVSQGASQQLSAQQIAFDHLLLSALVATKPDADNPQALRYKHPDGSTHQVEFDPIPERIHELNEQGVYPLIHCLPPLIHQPSDFHTMHLDQLLNRIMGDEQ
jgi:predicted YcjX-like family ATPase